MYRRTRDEAANIIFSVKPNEIKTVKSRTRLTNFAIDIIVCAFAATAVQIYLAKINGNEILTKTNVYIIEILTIFIYYFFMELAFNRTVGKIITKTKVVKLDGSEIKSEDVFRRTLIRFIPLFDALSFLNTEKTGLHDIWSRTKLIKIQSKINKQSIPETQIKITRFLMQNIYIKIPDIKFMHLISVFSMIAITHFIIIQNKMFWYRSDFISNEQFMLVLNKMESGYRRDNLAASDPVYFGFLPRWIPNIFLGAYFVLVIILIIQINTKGYSYFSIEKDKQ